MKCIEHFTLASIHYPLQCVYGLYICDGIPPHVYELQERGLVRPNF